MPTTSFPSSLIAASLTQSRTPSQQPTFRLANKSQDAADVSRALSFNARMVDGKQPVELFKSLSAVAKRVTGSHWNGYKFFNLNKEGGSR